ncbi:MAG: pur operon repressor [Lactobacillus sp.]|nr:pur operon repressor [Lactobacillus sp.]
MKRSERLVDMTKYLLEHPHKLISLTFFAERYDSAKSSISEDLAILKQTLASNQSGILETVAGAAGGVRYIPYVGKDQTEEYVLDLAKRIEDPNRILPGNFVYLSDILNDPEDLRRIGEIVATRYAYDDIDAVMTIETKGIPLAQSAARYLNVPFVVARKRNKVTEGATMSVNYISSSLEIISKMGLPTRALPKGARVLVIDDFMKGGGTLVGMEQLVHEFEGTVAGAFVLCEADIKKDKMMEDYVSLIKITQIDHQKKLISSEIGNFLARTDFDRI